MKSIRDLGAVGVIYDLPHYELPVNAFSKVSNIRFNDNTASKSPAPIELLTVDNIVAVATAIVDDASEIFIATNNQLLKVVGDTSEDISREMGYSESQSWQTTTWGESIIFNNGLDAPQIKFKNSDSFIDLPHWPSEWRCKVIRKYKSFLIAIGVTKNGVLNHSQIVWSTESADDYVPDTWDETDTTALAGFNTFTSSSGALVDCLTLGDANIVYTRSEVWAMQFIGGGDVFSFSRLFEGGIVSSGCITEFDDSHCVVGNDSIYIHDGNSKKHIADDRVKDYFYGSASEISSTQIVASALNKEIWIKYKQGEGTKAIVWCYQKNTFTEIDLFNGHFLTEGHEPSDLVTYSSADFNYISSSNNYSDYEAKSYRRAIFLLSENTLFLLDRAFDNSSCLLERTGMDLDHVTGTATNIQKHISQVWPQISGAGEVYFQFGGADSANGAVSWEPPVLFDIGKDEFVDTRITARYLAYRVFSESISSWGLTGLDIDLETSYDR